VSSSYGMSGVSRALATIRVPWRDGASSSVTANASGYSTSATATAERDRRALSRARTSGGDRGAALPGTRPVGSRTVICTPSSSSARVMASARVVANGGASPLASMQ